MLVTATTLLGGVGALPSGGAPSYAAGPTADPASTEDAADGAAASLTTAEQRAKVGTRSTSEEPQDEEAPDEPVADEPDPEELLVPGDSGEGRRVVFDEAAQRVWLVKADGSVARTYLVSGSIYDNLDPGTYQVYSRSPEAWGIDDSGTMRYMVRFTTGGQAPIGFHDIPRLDGKKVQKKAELGTPLSHGCIRQARPDAKALWDFAPLGTTVVVVDTSEGEAPTSDEDQSEEG